MQLLHRRGASHYNVIDIHKNKNCDILVTKKTAMCHLLKKQNRDVAICRLIVNTKLLGFVLIHILPCPICTHDEVRYYFHTHVVVSCILPPPEYHEEMHCVLHI
jgi:hypothetical protein